MKTFKLHAEARTELGKKATKALRAAGMIPVVLNGGEQVALPYEGKLLPGQKIVEIGEGKGLITTDLAVSQEAVRKLIYTPDIYAIELDIDGEKLSTEDSLLVGTHPTGYKCMAVIKDIQFQAVKDTILHIDLLEVTDKKPVVIEIPVKIEGHAEGVKAGGKLTLSMKKVKVKAIYTEVPERVIVNVDTLGLGKTLKIGDLHYDAFELVNAKNAVVCAVQLTRAARGAAAAEK